MDFNEYQQLAARTAKEDREEMLNYGLGISGEAGEVSDMIKKVRFQGHSYSKEEVCKELGDVLWYVSQIARLTALPLEYVAEQNILKLKKRYPNGFSEERSVNRDE
jgi:NTP pyrophosphatase (non-canonical NTP hydrolase)